MQSRWDDNLMIGYRSPGMQLGAWIGFSVAAVTGVPTRTAAFSTCYYYIEGIWVRKQIFYYCLQ